MTAYPSVLSEAETLRRVVAGASLARYGDGELQLMARGSDMKRQVFDAGLQRRLRDILCHAGSCLVGIPNLHCPTPKRAHWRRFSGYGAWFGEGVTYGSAFVSRPDSAPWIDTPDYWTALESLWLGQNVTLVRGSALSLTAADLAGAASVTEVVAPARDAWASYDELLAQVGTPARAILCLGPTATVMAVDLCAKGVHAIDLGHAGLFLRKHRCGEPMVVTDADKAVA